MAEASFYFDFGSPNAYLSHRVIPAVEQRAGARFNYIPILLGGIFKLTNNRSPAAAFAGIKNKLEYEALETRRFIQRHQLSAFRGNPFFPVNTLQLMRGAVAAKQAGVFDAYVETMFAAMWERGLKMDDPEVIRAVLQEAGLPADALLELIGADAVKQELMRNTELAVSKGAFGSPTFFVGEEIYFGKDRLWEVEAALHRQNHPPPGSGGAA